MGESDLEPSRLAEPERALARLRSVGMSDEVDRLRAELAWVRSVVALHQQNGCGLAISRIGEALGGDQPPYPTVIVLAAAIEALVEHLSPDPCSAGYAIRNMPEPHRSLLSAILEQAEG